MLRIALIGDWYLPRVGGIEVQVHDLARRLRAAGHDVEVVTSTPGPRAIDDIPVHRLGAPRLPRFGIVYTRQPFRQLRELLERERYDLVHVHFGIVAPLAYGATSIAQRLGLPTIATFHSVLHGFALPLAVLRRVFGTDRWPVIWSGVSAVAADAMRPLVGAAADARVLPNAVDVEWWRRPAPATAARRGQPLRIVTVMRLHARKRPLPFARMIARAVDMLPESALRVTILGDGPQRRSLVRELSRLRLDAAVTLAGEQSREEVRDALHRADLFVLPSRLEAFGIAALEARAAGVPVIAMRSAGVGEFLHDGVDSCLVGDDGEMVSAIVRLARDPAERMRLAAGAAVPPAVTWEAMLTRYAAAARDAAALARVRTLPAIEPVAEPAAS